jgi:hypothetical protein
MRIENRGNREFDDATGDNDGSRMEEEIEIRRDKKEKRWRVSID